MKLSERSLFCLPFFAIFVIVLLTLCTFEVGAQLEPLNIPNIPAEGQNYSNLTDHSMDLDLTTLFNDVDQSVVQISENSASSLGSRQGSGFVYDNLGHIVTNYHVVGNPQETNLNERVFHITFLDGITYIGRVIGADLYSELAVMTVENITRDSLMPLPLGNSSQLKIGQPVVAVGNPFGLSGSMTEGIVSGLGRILPSSVLQGDLLLRQEDTPSFLIPNIIQTDAVINPGNSGGPLLTTGGEVIGMNTAILSNTGVYAGIGSAIPSDIIKKVVPELISTGIYRHPYIGIAGVNMSPEISDEMGLNGSRGFLVTEVTSGSPAERSGIRGGGALTDINGRQIELGGDVIVAVDNVSVRKIEDLLSYLQSERSIGETVMLSVIRDGKNQQIGMTLAARPTQQQQEIEQRQQERPTLGINSINMTEQIAARMNLTQMQQQPLIDDQDGERGGVLVVDVFADGPAEEAGIRGGFIVADINRTLIEIGGDVIVRIDDTMIPNVDALNKFIDNKNIGDTIQVTVVRNSQPIIIPVIVGSTSELGTLQPGNGSNFSTQPIDRSDDFFSELYDRCIETFGPSVCNPLFRR
ncbi:MAG: PDZ domain-containing protein [Nitrososphaeraceae archaeon]|nr:PDZ domain-containing protein [Nitrososphaeraceae archaeon]